MKKLFFSLVLISISLHGKPKGMLPLFMQQTNDALPIPSPEALAATATVIGGITVGGIAAFQKSAEAVITRAPQTRSLSISLASTIFSSPYVWAVMGGSAVVFAVNYFIGYEMGVIIETKGTLKALAKQIELWQTELPKLKENQENLASKVKNALGILDTITPLVVKLAKNSETEGAAQQISVIQQELASLKETVQALTTSPSEALLPTVEKKSHSLFGFGKKKPRKYAYR
jgi:hypothetical protein